MKSSIVFIIVSDITIKKQDYYSIWFGDRQFLELQFTSFRLIEINAQINKKCYFLDCF